MSAAVTDPHPVLALLSHWLLDLSVEARVAYHTGALARIREQQRVKLTLQIAAIIGPGVVFSARELWDHRLISPALAAAFDEAGITNVHKLGKRLRQLCGAGIVCVGLEHNRALWMVA